MSEGPMVELEGLRACYGRVEALRGLTASLDGGAVGLLGPNGAGKTSLFRVLMGFLEPSAGSCRVLGLPVGPRPLEIRRLVGYMPETDSFLPGLTAVSFLAYAAELHGLPRGEALSRAHEALHYVGLGEARYRRLETYSRGMRQRAKLAQALVHGPRLLLLDEPTSGLDPAGRAEMLELVRGLAAGGAARLIFSSHLLPDVEQVCSRVVVLREGRIAAAGPLEELRAAAGSAWDLRLKGDAGPFLALAAARGLRCRPHPDEPERLRAVTAAGEGTALFFRLAAEAGAQIRGLARARSTLEDVYLEAMAGEKPAAGGREARG